MNKKDHFEDRNSRYVNKQIMTCVIISLFSALCAIAILFDNNRPEHYLFLPVMPITFVFCLVIALNKLRYLFNKVSITIIILTYFVRMTILPIFIFLGGYSILFGNYNVVMPYDLVYENMNIAIFLTCYEAIIVFVAIATSKLSNEDFKYDINPEDTDGSFSKNYSTLFKIIIVTILVFSLLSIIAYPILLKYISFFVNTSIESDLVNSRALFTMREVVPSVIYWLYVAIIRFLQLFIPILLIRYVYNKSRRKKWKFPKLTSLIIIGLVFSFMTPEKINSVLISISLFIIVCLLYPSIKKIAPVIITILTIVSALALMLKSGVYAREGGLWEFASTTINAYFGGPLNVAAALSMDQNVTFKIIIADIFNAIPFASHFLSGWSYTTPDYFNFAIKGFGTQTTKIIPMVGQGYYYFGFILAPLISFIFIKFAIVFERKISIEKDMFKKYIYIFSTVFLSISPVLYNLNIILSNLCYIALFIILMKISQFGVTNKKKSN